MMALLMYLILLISVHEIVNGQDSFTIEHRISRSEDDIELYETECESTGINLDLAYQKYKNNAEDVLLTFRNIAYDDIVNAQEARIEFQSKSNVNLPLSTVIRYNTIAAYDEANCKVSHKDNWSNSTVVWDLPVTVTSQIFTTNNIINLVQENLQSQLWRDTGRLELIISQKDGPNANDGNAVRVARSYDGWASDPIGNYPPKLVLKLPVHSSASPSSSLDYDQTTAAISSPAKTPSSSGTNSILAPGSTPSPTFSLVSSSAVIESSTQTSVPVPSPSSSLDYDQTTAAINSPAKTPSSSSTDSILAPGSTPSPTFSLSPSSAISESILRSSATVPSPSISCSTNIYMKGYLIVNHTSAVETVTSAMKCCKKCSEIRESCKSFSIGKLKTSGSAPSYICQINNITKEESDRGHCFTKDDTFTHYNVFP